MPEQLLLACEARRFSRFANLRVTQAGGASMLNATLDLRGNPARAQVGLLATQVGGASMRNATLDPKGQPRARRWACWRRR